MPIACRARSTLRSGSVLRFESDALVRPRTVDLVTTAFGFATTAHGDGGEQAARTSAAASTATSPRRRVRARRSSVSSRAWPHPLGRRLRRPGGRGSRRGTPARSRSAGPCRLRRPPRPARAGSRTTGSRGSDPPATHSFVADEILARCRRSSRASSIQSAQTRPLPEEGLVRDLDRGLPRVGIAIEREQPVTPERLDHGVHRLRLGERRELRTPDAPPRVLGALAQRDEPEEQLPAGVAARSRSSVRTAAPRVGRARRIPGRSAGTPSRVSARRRRARRAR